MTKLTCVLCKNKADEQTISRAKSQINIAILLSTLKVYASSSYKSVEEDFAAISVKRHCICIRHYIDAAQYLLQEVLASGRRLSTTMENVCYLNEGDIPAHIPAHLNDAIKTFSGDVTVTTSNLNRYLNVYVGKYYDQNDGWHMPGPCRSLFLQKVEKETSAGETGCSMDAEMVVKPGPQSGSKTLTTPGGKRPSFLEKVKNATTSAKEASSSMVVEMVAKSGSQGGTKTPTKSVAVSPSRTVFSTPSVKHAESGSSGGATTGTCFTPGKLPESDSDAPIELEETDPALLDKYFVVQGRKLLELFNLGSSEGEAGNVCLKIHHSGAIPLIEYVTKGPKPQIRKWEGQGKLGEGPKEKLFSGTSLACAAAITTGARWTKVNHWAKEMNLLLPSRSAFYNFFKRMRPAIETVYDRYEARTILEIRGAYENQRLEGWNVAIDGAYDSRGHSADFCKVLAVDLQTGLCVHTEVVYRKETGGKSGLMEKVGFHRILRWFRSMNIPLHSISTDRSYALKKEVDSYNAEYGDHIKWHVDPWHLAKYLDKNLRAIEKRKDCEAIHEWKHHIKAHLYHSIRRGAQINSGEMMKFYFNTCLYHVAGVHRWRQNEQTGTITQCAHEGTSDERGKAIVAWGSPAHNRLKEVILQQEFQKDIKLASPYGGTSQCESKNSLDRIYGPKEVYLPASTYSIFAKLATLHKNALRRAELSGERVVERVTKAHRKFCERESKIERKTPIQHLWRKEIWMEFLTNYITRPADEEQSVNEEPTDEEQSTDEEQFSVEEQPADEEQMDYEEME